MNTRHNILHMIILSLVLSACAGGGKKAEPIKTLRVGSLSVTNPTVIHIKSDSLFKKHGLDFNVEYTEGANGSALMEMFLGGKLDIAVFGDQPSVMGWLRGVDVKAVANFPSSPRSTYVMVADSVRIKSMRDLRGKKVSVQVGTVSQHWLFLSLDQAGMKPSEVTMLNVPGGDASVALMTHEIDAAVLSEPTISLLEEKKVAAKIKESYCTKTYSNLLLVSGDIYRNHPEIIKNIIATYKEANDWVIDNPDKTSKLISSKITYRNIDSNIIKRQYGRNLSKTKYLGFPDSTILSFKQIVGFLRDLKAVPEYRTLADSIEKFYDPRFVNEFYNDLAAKEHISVDEVIKRETSSR